MQVNVGTVPGQAAEAEVLVDLNGNPIIFGSQNTTIATYNVTVNDVTPAALATDVLTLSGSATKTISITRIKITADASGACEVDFYAYKRIAPNTGGTVTHPAIVKYDSLNSAPTAVVNLYSANPLVLGAGTLFAGSQFIVPGTSGNTWLPVVPVIVDYGTRNNQAIVLRGVNESIAISLNGNTVPAGLGLYITIEWTES